MPISRALRGLATRPGPRDSVVTHEQYHGSAAVPRTKGVRPTTRVVDPPQLHDDMPVTDVAFVSGGPMPFEETHVMKHALCAVEAKAAYKGNRDRAQVEASDFIWLRTFWPQAGYTGEPGPIRQRLAKDLNRHPRLRPPKRRARR
ncbi:hypothetical protein [Pararhodobacter marinus]|nr:hypothetical protein [Pararhodobacter marinus]